jgi:hypothetical protein
MKQVTSGYEFIAQLEVLPKEELARRVLLEILTDVENRDVEATFELLSFLPHRTLKGFLREED